MFLRTSGVKPLYICMAVAFLTVFGACHEEVVSAAAPESGPLPDSEAPSVPQDVSATPAAQDRIEVSWAASSDNVGVTGYRIERDGSVAHETAQTSWSDDGLEAGSTHAYRVLAYDEAGNLSDWSAAASATTPDDDPDPQDVWYVGPGRTYQTIPQVAPLLEPGDLVLVDGGHVYAGAIMFSVPGMAEAPITIRGVRVNGSRPVIEGGRDVVEFNMNHYVFEGFEIRNAGFRGLFHHADDITIRDCVVHDCPHGILGADQGSGDCTLEYCELYHNGEGSGRHQVYMATNEDDYPGSVFRMQFCYVHDGTGGNNVKSRAERNEIYYNWLETPYYHNLELIGPDPEAGVAQDRAREDSDVAGNVLITQRYPRNVRIGGDSDGAGSYGRYRFVNNTFIHRNGDPRSHIFAHFGVESVEMHNNVFYIGSYTVFDDSECEWASGRRVSGANNWVLTGATYPAEWTGTLSGSSPGFVDIDAGLFVPAAGSALLDAGVSETVSPAGSPFPDPLPLPLYLPPQRVLLAPGTGQLRPISVIIDIGAFEGN